MCVCVLMGCMNGSQSIKQNDLEGEAHHRSSPRAVSDESDERRPRGSTRILFWAGLLADTSKKMEPAAD